MAAGTKQPRAAFDAASFRSFRFLGRELDAAGTVTLSYALDDKLTFSERLTLPVAEPLGAQQIAEAQGLLSLLHWVAGVSYYKAALPPAIAFESPAPGPAAARLLEALYSEGLGELAYVNGLPALPRPLFSGQAPPSREDGERLPAPAEPRRALVAVGGGKDSAVAIEVLRRSGAETVLFSVGDAAPIARTAHAAGLPRLIARRELDPVLFDCNAAGAINGHVPITAIVTCIALLSAALNGFDTVAMANERSASAGNLRWDGVEINHQFSKSLAAERLLSAAVAEAGATVRQLSVLRPASELAIARAFAGMPRYHGAFTSCNAIFRIDPALRASSWCRDCPKCRFVFLAMAPFSAPEHLAEVFGADMLADESQFEGFALLAAAGGHKPFECVGEEQESLAAMRLLAADERWRMHPVVARLAAEVLPRHPLPEGDPATVLALSDDHELPAGLLDDLRAVLRA
jgi:UDP-N-acetyl-alpha-D-muramoyl-L-alanyl-L-glutamate epimerase